MKILRSANTKSFIAYGLLSFISSGLYAAPGTLVDTPLNLGTAVEPNILMLVDDSGSMDWEQLISNDAQSEYNVSSNGRATNLDFTPDNNTELLELCSAYNVMAYNPAQTYEPWSGVDEEGNLYTDKTLTTALNNPYDDDDIDNVSNHFYMTWADADNSGTFDADECSNFSNLDGSSTPGGFNIYNIASNTSSNDAAGYVTDSGGVNGNYSNNETNGFLIQPTGASQITLSFSAFDIESGYDFLRVYSGTSNAGTLEATLDGTSIPADVVVNSGSMFIEFESDFSVTPNGFVAFWNHSSSGVTSPALPDGNISLNECRADGNCVVVADLSAAEQQNYANWYTYYRKREYVVKKALSEVVTDSTARMGLATLHNNQNVGTLIEDISNATDKQALLDNLFNINSSGGTPLRQALENAGEYFEQGKSPDTSFLGFAANHPTSDNTVSTDSPILDSTNGGQCQQNFTLLFSDGFWNGSAPTVGNTDTDGNGIYDGGAYADSNSNTLADVAMNYFERDLATSLADELGLTLNGDSVDHQHMTTYTVAFGVNGTLNSNPPDFTTAFTWPAPSANANTTIDDMRHAAFNGRGEFLNASNPQDLIDKLNAVIQDIDDRTATNTAAAFSTSEVSTDTDVFLTVFNTETWWGDLQAFSFSGASVSKTASWSADEEMKALIGVDGSNFANRNVITYNGQKGVPFAFPADYQNPTADELSDVQITDLITNAPDVSNVASTQAYGQNILNYLLGDSSNEGTFRSRNERYLGGMVHSSAVYVASPDGDLYPDNIESSSYLSYVTSKKDRSPMVYVGGNGGMLHGFYAADAVTPLTGNGGEEVFAYVPQVVSNPEFGGNQLHKLAELDYLNTAYVDNTPNAVDVFVDRDFPSDTSFAAQQWRTYLVGSFRSGGKGIYVLDITDPALLADAENNADKIVVREYTHPDLGYTYSEPQIVRLNNGRWAAVVGNGYNNYPEGDGSSKLFIIYLDAEGGEEIIDASSHTWTNCGAEGLTCLLNDSRYVRYGAAGKYFYQEFSADFVCNNATFGDPIPGTVKACDISNVDGNGLSQPTIVDLNGDRVADRVYAGDLHGNFWTFDISDQDKNTAFISKTQSETEAAQWGIAHNNGTTDEPLFIACRGALSGGKCSEADRQPITAAPTIRSNPRVRASATAPNILALFGTGQYIASDDNSDFSGQSFYGVWDAGSTHGGLERSNLASQVIVSDTTNVDLDNDSTTTAVELETRTIAPAVVNPAAGQSEYVTYSLLDDPSTTSQDESNFGWYMDLRGYDSTNGFSAFDGERSIRRPLVFGEILLFVTNTPVAGFCQGGGSSFVMAVNAVDGGQPEFAPFDINGDGLFDDNFSFKSERFIQDPNVLGTGGGKGVAPTTGDSGQIGGPAGDAPGIQGSTSRAQGRKSWSIIR